MDESLKYRISLEDLFSRGIATAEQNAKKFEGSVTGIDKAAQSLKSTLATAFSVYAITAFGKSVLNTGASFERAEIQLKTLLKSGDEANAVFKDLQTESTKSPFTFQELLKGNAALISTGISAKKAKEDFNALANAIAATGGTGDDLSRMTFNLQQIKNVGATAQDIKQFGMAGINIYGLLDKYAKQYNITIDKHHITYEQIIGSLKLAGKEGGQYFNALNNLADSTSGRLLNLTDSFDVFKDKIFKDAKPAINSVIEGLTGILNHAPDIIRGFKMMAVAVAGFGAGLLLVKGYMIATNTIAKTMFVVDMVKYVAATRGITGATSAWQIIQASLNTTLLANPYILVGAALAALAVGIYNVYAENKRLKEQIEGSMQTAAQAELKTLDAKIARYKELGKTAKQAYEDEKSRLRVEVAKATNEVAAAKRKVPIVADLFGDNQLKVDYLKKKQLLDALSRQQSALMGASAKVLKGDKGEVGADLGSGLSEPKASSIKNITINMNNPFQNMKVTPATMEMGID